MLIHCYGLYLLFAACWFNTPVNKICFPMLSLYQLSARIWFAQPVSHQQGESWWILFCPDRPNRCKVINKYKKHSYGFKLWYDVWTNFQDPRPSRQKFKPVYKIPNLNSPYLRAHISFNVSVENLALKKSRQLLSNPCIKRKTVIFVECNEIWVFIVLVTTKKFAFFGEGCAFRSYLIFRIFNLWMPRSEYKHTSAKINAKPRSPIASPFAAI